MKAGNMPERRHKEQHEMFMQRALQLAQQGMGRTSPNPMVGAVVVRDGEILSEGYHTQCGALHAEAMAIAQAQEMGIDLRGSTMYVTLEPCNHHGRRPPCSEAIVRAGIKEVYIGVEDPNRGVAGGGAHYLTTHGVHVHMPCMEKEAIFLNRRFFTFQSLARPYVVLKWAQTLDGFLDSERSASDPFPWISNRVSRFLVHQWRAQEDAILVGTNTVERDNPQLTVRACSGESPLRVVLDRSLRLLVQRHVFNGEVPTVLIVSDEEEVLHRAEAMRAVPQLEVISLDFNTDVERALLTQLHVRGVQSVIVEGGTKVLNSFINKGLWDEARLFIGDSLLGRGTLAPCIEEGREWESVRYGDTYLRVLLREDLLTPWIQ